MRVPSFFLLLLPSSVGKQSQLLLKPSEVELGLQVGAEFDKFLFQTPSKYFPNTFLRPPWNLLDTFQNPGTPDTFQIHIGPLADTFQTPSRHMRPFLHVQIRWGFLFQTPSKHLPDSFLKPSWYLLPDTIQNSGTIVIPSRHVLDTFQTPTRHIGPLGWIIFAKSVLLLSAILLSHCNMLGEILIFFSLIGDDLGVPQSLYFLCYLHVYFVLHIN